MFFDLFKTKPVNQTDEFRVAVRDIVEQAVGTAIAKLRGDFDVLNQLEELKVERTKLKESVEDLKLSKERKQEEFDRREREIEHKVGLERKRQEQELELARKEAEIDAREANLDQEKKAFAERMEFFRDELDDQKDLLNRVLERLPSAEIIARIGGNGGGNGDSD